MTHRATVERDTQNATNADGHLGPPDFQPLGSALACFFYTSTGRESVSADRTVVVRRLALLAPLGADITERDRINGIEDRAGNVLLTGVVNVRSILRHHTHLEISLEQAA